MFAFELMRAQAYQALGFDARSRYYADSFLSGLPFLSAYFQARDKVNYMDDYMENRGLDWSDIKYPSMTVGFQGVAGLTSYVSSNVVRLYK